jgi:hypothetical protein
MAFKATIRLLAAASLTIIEDYPIQDELSSHKLLTHYMSKSQLTKLRADIRRSLRFLFALSPEKETPSINEFKKWADTYDEWHKKITKYHIHHHSHQWSYFGIALHYMIDAYYHIFKRLTLDPKRHHKRTCDWCDLNLVTSWKKLLSKMITESLPSIYLYTTLAQEANTNTDLAELPAIALGELQELGRKALRA